MHLTGVFSKDGRWAQLDNNGWVFVGQIKTSVALPRRASRESEWETPAGAGAFYRGRTFEEYESPYWSWESPARAGRSYRGRGFRSSDLPYESWEAPAGAGSGHYWGYEPYGYTSSYYGSAYPYYYGSGCSTCGGGFGGFSGPPLFPSFGFGFGY